MNATQAISKLPGHQAPAIDSHVHAFRVGLAMSADATYLPVRDADLAAYSAIARRTGIAAAVLVQPSFLGTDNTYLCSLLAGSPRALRGIAVVDSEIEEEEIDRLGASGVVGIRLNLDARPLPDLSSRGPWHRVLGSLAARGWHVEIHRHARDLPALIDPLLDAGVEVVVDHFGRPDGALGRDDPGFRHLLQTASTGRVWVKLSGAYRNGGDGVLQAPGMAQALLAAFGPRRLLWGSDWPHTRHEAGVSVDDLFLQFARWIPDPSDRRWIQGANAIERFGFEPDVLDAPGSILSMTTSQTQQSAAA